jgi:aspartyl-tRNA(Asn)/glutamyl-tRNA(Gln) amidotransferase subunit C
VPAITREEVAHIARLARIDLTEAELDHLAPQLADILASVAKVSEVAAQDIPPTSHPLPLTNVFRPDEITSGLTAEQALAGAPIVDGERAVEDERFRVPRILDEEA